MLNLKIFRKAIFLMLFNKQKKNNNHHIYIYSIVPTSHPSIIQSFKYGANRSEVKTKYSARQKNNAGNGNKTSQMRRYKLHFVVRSINYLLKWIPLCDIMATARRYSQGNRFACDSYKYIVEREKKKKWRKIWVMVGTRGWRRKVYSSQWGPRWVCCTVRLRTEGAHQPITIFIIYGTGRRTITNNYTLLSKQHHWVWRDMANCFCFAADKICSFCDWMGWDGMCCGAPQYGSNISLQQLQNIHFA